LILLIGKTLKPRLPVCAEKDSPHRGDESARNEIPILIAGMPGGMDGEHPFFFADIIRLDVQHIHRFDIIYS
jgi:hypothetical protein